MKRILAVLISLILMFSLASCSDSANDTAQKPSNVSAGDNKDTQKTTEKPDDSEVSISETILLDEAGVKITAKSLNTDSFFGAELKLLIENNSGKDLTFQSRGVSVNGYMTESIMSVDVVNGKKANDTLTFMQSDFELCGIDKIADIELSFHIFDTAEWETYLDSEKIQIKTSIAETYEYSFDDGGDLAYEGNGVKIVVRGLTDDTIFGPAISVFIENTSGEDITVQTRDVSVNGFMMDTIFSSEVCAGKHAVDTILFMESDLEENDISEFEEVELSFHIFENTSWNTIVDTESIKLSF